MPKKQNKYTNIRSSKKKPYKCKAAIWCNKSYRQKNKFRKKVHLLGS